MARSQAHIEQRTNQPCQKCGRVAPYLWGRRTNGVLTLLCRSCWWEMEHERNRRRSVSPTVRKAVLARDGHRCVKCGDSRRLTVDHIIAIANGGTSDMSNLQTLCQWCNNGKSDKV